jgi:hypothetical protein
MQHTYIFGRLFKSLISTCVCARVCYRMLLLLHSFFFWSTNVWHRLEMTYSIKWSFLLQLLQQRQKLLFNWHDCAVAQCNFTSIIRVVFIICQIVAGRGTIVIYCAYIKIYNHRWMHDWWAVLLFVHSYHFLKIKTTHVVISLTRAIISNHIKPNDGS